MGPHLPPTLTPPPPPPPAAGRAARARWPAHDERNWRRLRFLEHENRTRPLNPSRRCRNTTSSSNAPRRCQQLPAGSRAIAQRREAATSAAPQAQDLQALSPPHQVTASVSDAYHIRTYRNFQELSSVSVYLIPLWPHSVD
ncbi:hypothetical protein DAI22_04g241233 [Oryza sativa Japonica Group]|nr:hypothetical protein DAI22_04g241233 [Oryza sativa Japonica Group]